MQRISPRESAGFRMLAASSDPSADPAPTSVCSSSMNTMMFGLLGQLLHDRLEALFELAAVLRAGHDQRDVEREDALVGEEVRHVAGDDPLREALDNRRLADAGLADEHGVVLRAAAEHLLHALHLVARGRPAGRARFFDGRLGQVAAELGQQRRLLGPRVSVVFSFSSWHDVLADRVQPHPLLHQDGGGQRPLLAQEAEQQVLGADVVVQQPVGLLGGELQHALGLGAERDLDRRRHLLAEDGAALDLLADRLERRRASGRRSGW